MPGKLDTLRTDKKSPSDLDLVLVHSVWTWTCFENRGGVSEEGGGAKYFFRGRNSHQKSFCRSEVLSDVVEKVCQKLRGRGFEQ